MPALANNNVLLFVLDRFEPVREVADLTLDRSYRLCVRDVSTKAGGVGVEVRTLLADEYNTVHVETGRLIRMSESLVVDSIDGHT